MEKKIIFTPVEPNRNLLWLHYRGDLLVLERFGSNGWESIGGTGSVTEEEFIEALKNKADLVSGKVPAEQLPSYVDDVMEFVELLVFSNTSGIVGKGEYANNIYITTNTTIDPYKNLYLNTGANKSIEDWTYIPLENGKIYLNTSNNHTYRWSGSRLIDLDKEWSDRINTLELKTLTSNLGTITNPLDLSESTSTSSFTQLYSYLSQRNKSSLINLLWYYNGAAYSSPIIDVDPIERTFAIYNQGYLQTYKVLKEDDNYSLVKVKEFPDFVYLDYSTVGSVLDDNTIERIRNASIVLVNSNPSMPNIKYIYNAKLKANPYFQFVRVSEIDSSENQIVYQDLSVNVTTKRWTITTKKYTLPYGAYSQFGFTGKSSAAVNQEVARLVNMNSYYITPSDLDKVHSGDKLENIKNATFLILDEGAGNTKIYIRGNTSTKYIHYTNIDTPNIINEIVLQLTTNTLLSVRSYFTDNSFYENYLANGGTKGSKTLMYKELVAQLTENTYVIDSSKLNTTLTDAEANSIANATTLIVTNALVANNTLVFVKGSVSSGNVNFCCVSNSTNGRITLFKIIYYSSTKTCSNIITANTDSYTYYASYGGKLNTQDFNKSLVTLFDNVYVIDSSLLNTTITDTNIREGISKANILIIEDSTDNSYTVCIRGITSNNRIYFFNLRTVNADNITANRISFNTITNLLNKDDTHLYSAFSAYKLGGGTKYTTESTFNTRFAEVMDA